MLKYLLNSGGKHKHNISIGDAIPQALPEPPDSLPVLTLHSTYFPNPNEIYNLALLSPVMHILLPQDNSSG